MTTAYDLEGTRQKMLDELRVGSMPLEEMLNDKGLYQHGHKLLCTVIRIDDMLVADIHLLAEDGALLLRNIHRADLNTADVFEAGAVNVARRFMSRLIQQGVYGAQEMQKRLKLPTSDR